MPPRLTSSPPAHRVIRPWLILLSLVFPFGVCAQSYQVTTIAGQIGTIGSADGAGANARFNFIRGLTADAAGSLYVVDSFNATIRRVTAAGVVTTVAGSAGVRDSRDGTGSAALFNSPNCIAGDSAGNLYVGDANRQTFVRQVRKITPAGVVTTFVSVANGFNIQGLAVDSEGHVIVVGGGGTQWFDSAGRAFLPNWLPTAVVSPTGPPRTLGDIGFVSGLAVDRGNTIWVADGFRYEIRKVLPTGAMTTFAGLAGVEGYLDGTSSSARFKSPSSIAIDSGGNLYVADSGAIRRIAPTGVVTTVAGSVNVLVPRVQDGIGGTARFQGTISLAIGSGDTLYVADDYSVRKATPTSAVATLAPSIASATASSTTAAGERATFAVTAYGVPEVTYQWQRASAGSNAWVNLTDSGVYSGTTSATLTVNGVTLAMNGDRLRCVVTNSAGTAASAPATLSIDPPVVVVPLRVTTLPGPAGGSSRYQPQHVATDAAGNVYVADAAGYCIRKITPSGTITTLTAMTKVNLGAIGATLGLASSLGPVAVDAQGNVFFVEALLTFGDPTLPSPTFVTTSTIRKVTPAGVVTTIRQDDPSGHLFGNISAMVFDRSGNLAITTSSGVVRLSPDGRVATVIPILAVRANVGPLAFDSGGNFLFAGVSHVVRVAPTGDINSSVAGLPNVGGAVDGRAVHARFSNIRGLAVDGAGNIYVSDNGAIRKISTSGFVSTVASIKVLAGQPPPAGVTDGIGSAARFNSPAGLTIDRAGNLYIVDSNNFAIRKAVPVDAVALGEPTGLDVSLATSDALPLVSRVSRSAAVDSMGRAVAAAGGTTYQWFKDTIALAGATGTQLRIPATRMSDAGDYQVQMVTSDGAVTSAPVTLAVTGSRLTNLSIRSGTDSRADTLIVGFVVAGEGLPLLIRGVGPSLTAFGVAAPAAQPTIMLHASGQMIASNRGWENAADIMETGARVGAFALPQGSLDAALLTTLPGGGTTVQCTNAGVSAGVALVEVYDGNVLDAGRSRLINLSARARVGLADNVMIAGFAIRGSTARRILLRGIGPTLAQFSVADALLDTSLQLFDSRGGLIAQNDDWTSNGDAGGIANATQAVGAFALPPRSRDSALLVTLAPGTYSAQLSAKTGGTGIGLIEVYEAP